MSLMINTNITSLNAWGNLIKTDRSLSSTMEKLSSGMRINKAADDPSGLVISEQMRGQIVGLKAAIKNSEKGISMIQTAEGALDKVHALLDKMRGLAVDSANSATSDANMLAANQAEMDNIIATITRISENTQYGTKTLLDGTNAVIGALDTTTTGAASVDAVTLAAGQEAVESLNLTVAATVADNTFTPGTSGADIVDQGTLALDTYTLALDGALDDVTAASGTGLVFVVSGQDNYDGTFSGDLTFTADGAQAFVADIANTAGLTVDYAGATAAAVAWDVSESTLTWTDDAANVVTVTLDTAVTGTLADLGTASMTVQAATATAALTDGDGDAVGTTVNLDSSSTLTSVAVGGADFDLSGVTFAAAFSDTATLEVTSVDGFEASVGSADAVNVFDDTTVQLTDENDNVLTVTFGTVAAGTDAVSLTDNSLVFQIGANQGQTVNIAIQDMSAEMLSMGVTNDSGFANLSEITVTTSAMASDAIGLIDAAIDQVSVVRGGLGAFQANTLEANLDSLRVSSENLQASESIIRDTDMAAEMSEFTKYQILLQAGTSMLAQANQIPTNLLTLLG